MTSADTEIDVSYRERVRRPNGKVWAIRKATGPRRVLQEGLEKALRSVMLIRTHDVEKAREACAEKWTELHPDLAMPDGRQTWRRARIGAFGQNHEYHVRDFDPCNPNTFPVVVFEVPADYEPPKVCDPRNGIHATPHNGGGCFLR